MALWGPYVGKQWYSWVYICIGWGRRLAGNLDRKSLASRLFREMCFFLLVCQEIFIVEDFTHTLEDNIAKFYEWEWWQEEFMERVLLILNQDWRGRRKNTKKNWPWLFDFCQKTIGKLKDKWKVSEEEQMKKLHNIKKLLIIFCWCDLVTRETRLCLSVNQHK